jgi:hypothetical protein
MIIRNMSPESDRDRSAQSQTAGIQEYGDESSDEIGRFRIFQGRRVGAKRRRTKGATKRPGGCFALLFPATTRGAI